MTRSVSRYHMPTTQRNWKTKKGKNDSTFVCKFHYNDDWSLDSTSWSQPLGMHRPQQSNGDAKIRQVLVKQNQYRKERYWGGNSFRAMAITDSAAQPALCQILITLLFVPKFRVSSWETNQGTCWDTGIESGFTAETAIWSLCYGLSFDFARDRFGNPRNPHKNSRRSGNSDRNSQLMHLIVPRSHHLISGNRQTVVSCLEECIANCWGNTIRIWVVKLNWSIG